MKASCQPPVAAPGIDEGEAGSVVENLTTAIDVENPLHQLAAYPGRLWLHARLLSFPDGGPIFEDPLPPELLLYKYDACPYCRRVQRRIAELGITVPIHDTRTDPAASGELYRQTGRTQVPCLFIDGEPLFESADIIEWPEQAAAAPRAP